ncbi:MAG: hypothetical protein COW24_02535 [Candidatus Kerfeldbacteria bacterium CG15_BIG_FIL_POST_REV_8_21_14_020_45_12]|uniref:Bacterial type II secretion system protein E domain-containing protein n=1 Tax=Candidatus Kerfeldbacteria bacterium CG15_BIG_FIL_POST_REV_8_21_14_020_45_12 TaxID=2014247 RepID=A0A2M7H427_9BACT|nr:MAG: hypothetical protein COW24_02535 [Candidatus Kerfeldbacteria bacterium CG15_BIG_FIL_POST_REV_8_21_14_020_45_12]PJA93500.1 MAG: hypothetical protein CO132_02620 [Candidatus Kerfeldbacteria bacterium CG_4_9_14_3_um_filter_45_8]
MRPQDSLIVIQRLQEKGLLQPLQVQTVLQKAQTSGKDALVVLEEESIVPDEQLVQTKSEILGVPYVELADKEIMPDVLNVLNQEIAENYKVVPFARKDNEIAIAMLDPHDYKAIEALDFVARRDNLHMKFYITSETSMDYVLRKYANLTREVTEALEGGNDDSIALDDTLKEESQEASQNAPVSKMVSVILRYAVEGNASDVHIEPADDGTRVRYRVDGILHTSLQVPKNVHDSLVARIKVMANLKLDETRLPQDGRFRMTIDGREIDFRVSTLPLFDREKVVLRILDKEAGVHSLEELGFSDHNLQVIMRNLMQPHGMILMTGPTGSGKSTTLYAMLETLNQDERNIITLEDPVEYNIPGISQSQMRPEIGLTFSRGLRSVLRQDPDIIMVGEIRDNETAELAIHAALTGHMLLSTLHTNDAIGCIPRLADMNVEPFLIASALRVVVAQRLIRKMCEYCREEVQLPPEMESKAMMELQAIPKESLPEDIFVGLPLRVFRGKGCQRCEDTGYRGRISISEVIEVTEGLKDIIAKRSYQDWGAMDQELRAQGMISMKQDGLIKALRGDTSVEEVWTGTEE